MNDKNLYDVMGLTEEDRKLPPEEFKKKLKKIFRKESLANHPDKCVNKPERERKACEERFKEVSAAYDVLSDDKKRRDYDMSMNGGDGFIDPFEMFKHNPFFSGGFDMGHMKKKGTDIRVNVNVTVDNVINGGTVNVEYDRMGTCTHCKRHICPHCNGTGMISDTQRNGFSIITRQYQCNHCNGTGYISDNSCQYCHGSGFEKERCVEAVDVPRGVQTGMAVRLNGKGNGSSDGGENGDLIVVFNVVTDGNFTIDRNNVYTTVRVSIADAMCGTDLELANIDGTRIKVRIPPLTRDGKTFKVTGKGLPELYGGMGSLYFKVEYIMPDGPLTKEQEKLIRKFCTFNKNV